MIGPFYCINHTVYAHAVPLEQAEKYGDALTTGYSHLRLWDETLAKRFPKVDYAYYPRGRVVYKEKEGFIVYVDTCLKDVGIIQDISKVFSIEGGWITEHDEHYQCEACLAREHSVVYDEDDFGKNCCAYRQVDALRGLAPHEYSAFKKCFQQAFRAVCKREDLRADVTPLGHIGIYTNDGNDVTSILAQSESFAAELAYKAALAQICDKPLALFRVGGCMDAETKARALSYIRSLPPARLILSQAFLWADGDCLSVP